MKRAVTLASALLALALAFAACDDAGPSGDFAIFAGALDVSAQAGSTVEVPFGVGHLVTPNEAAGEVTVTLAGAPEDFSAEAVTLAEDAIGGALVVHVPAGLARGEYTLTLHATSGAHAHDATATIAIDVHAGLFDASFSGGLSIQGGLVALDPTSLAIASDGAVFVAGQNEQLFSSVVRLLPDGELDGEWPVAHVDAVDAPVLAADTLGGLYVGDAAAGSFEPLLTRLGPGGTVDQDFGGPGGLRVPLGDPGTVLGIAATPTGVRAVGFDHTESGEIGFFTTSAARPTTTASVVTVPPNPEVAFGCATATSDGGWIVAGGTRIHGPFVERLRADGTPDPAFGTDGFVLLPGLARFDAVAELPDGRIVAAGADRAPDVGVPFGHAHFVRLAADGTVDASFGTNGAFDLDYDHGSDVLALAVQPDGKLVALVRSKKQVDVRDSEGARIVRLLPDGSLDDGFADQGVLDVNAHMGLPIFGARLSLSPTEPLVLDGHGHAVFAVSVDHQRFAVGRVGL